MKYVIGITGLPNVGKSTFIRFVSLAEVEIANYPFTTLKPKEVCAFLETDELKELHKITKTPEVRKGLMYFLDVPGLIRGAHKGLGLGNEFLSYLRGCDAILEVVRCFRGDILHSENSIDPNRDLIIIEEEIVEAEKRHLENLISKFRKERNKNLETLEEIYNNLKPFFRIQENESLKPYNLLIAKPWFVIWNGNEKGEKPDSFIGEYVLDLKYELEIEENKFELPDEFVSQKQNFLNYFRKSLKFLQCFTFNENITQLWLVKNNTSYGDFASFIHKDFAEKFKYAEVITLEKFVKIKSWQLANKIGALERKGREDLVRENDIILIHI